MMAAFVPSLLARGHQQIATSMLSGLQQLLTHMEAKLFSSHPAQVCVWINPSPSSLCLTHTHTPPHNTPPCVCKGELVMKIVLPIVHTYTDSFLSPPLPHPSSSSPLLFLQMCVLHLACTVRDLFAAGLLSEEMSMVGVTQLAAIATKAPTVSPVACSVSTR